MDLPTVGWLLKYGLVGLTTDGVDTTLLCKSDSLALIALLPMGQTVGPFHAQP